MDEIIGVALLKICKQLYFAILCVFNSLVKQNTYTTVLTEVGHTFHAIVSTTEPPASPFVKRWNGNVDIHYTRLYFHL